MGWNVSSFRYNGKIIIILIDKRLKNHIISLNLKINTINRVFYSLSLVLKSVNFVKTYVVSILKSLKVY